MPVIKTLYTKEKNVEIVYYLALDFSIAFLLNGMSCIIMYRNCFDVKKELRKDEWMDDRRTNK